MGCFDPLGPLQYLNMILSIFTLHQIVTRCIYPLLFNWAWDSAGFCIVLLILPSLSLVPCMHVHVQDLHNLFIFVLLIVMPSVIHFQKLNIFGVFFTTAWLQRQGSSSFWKCNNTTKLLVMLTLIWFGGLIFLKRVRVVHTYISLMNVSFMNDIEIHIPRVTQEKLLLGRIIQQFFQKHKSHGENKIISNMRAAKSNTFFTSAAVGPV